MADLAGVQIDLRVYATAGNPAQAAQVAALAVVEGRASSLARFYAEEANAVGVAVASSGVGVTRLLEQPTIAGGNVSLSSGPTFRNTADRLVRYGLRNGVNNYLIVHGEDSAGPDRPRPRLPLGGPQATAARWPGSSPIRCRNRASSPPRRVLPPRPIRPAPARSS